MAIILETEIKSDLETIYKIAGDLLNEIQMQEVENCPPSIQQTLDLVKFRLEDIAGTLQKDIYTIGHLAMKTEVGV